MKSQKTWTKRHWKWLVPVLIIGTIGVSIFFKSGMNNVTSDLAQAYADNALYENALEKVKQNNTVTNSIGTIKPIGKMAILEGFVKFSENDKIVNSTIRISGDSKKAKLDIIAYWKNGKWEYQKINVRFKSSSEEKKIIQVIESPEF